MNRQRFAKEKIPMELKQHGVSLHAIGVHSWFSHVNNLMSSKYFNVSLSYIEHELLQYTNDVYRA